MIVFFILMLSFLRSIHYIDVSGPSSSQQIRRLQVQQKQLEQNHDTEVYFLI